MDASKTHYLQQELYQRMCKDPALFEFLQSGSLDGLWYWDVEDGNQEWMNERFWTTLGFDPKDKKHLASEWQDLIFPEDLAAALENFQKHCADPNYPYDQVVRYRHKDGSTVWVRCRGIGIRNESGKVIRMLGAHNDLTALKKTEQELLEKNRQLEQLVRHDYQTSLYNRLAFTEIFEQQLLLAAREQVPISLAMVDVDHFKRINDNLGHLKGDEVLIQIANTLKSTARESDILARFGGEEFMVLMFNTNHIEAMQAAERFRAAVEKQIRADGQNVTISAGLTTFGEKSIAGIDLTPSEIYEKMIASADIALYKAKQSGRNRVCS